MSRTVQTTDVVHHGSCLYQQRRYDLGDLPNASLALKDLGVVKSAKDNSGLRLKLILDETEHLGVAWENADIDCVPFVRRGTIRITREIDGTFLSEMAVKMQPFPPLEIGCILGTHRTNIVYNGYRRFHVVFDFPECAPVSTLLDTAKTATASSEVFTAFTYQQTPQDVCFVFPNTNTRLWMSSEVLINHSAYCLVLLSGKFSESAVHTSLEDAETPASTDDTTCRLYEESDDETDEYLADKLAKGARTPVSNLPHKKVVINDAAFTTYQATLVWMCSRYIRFAPLRSSKAEDTGEAYKSSLQDIVKTIEADPKKPILASPKSIYRLAHLLELKELEDIALENIRAQLTIRNAATELFSDVACAYPAVRDTILPYVVRYWAAVRTSSAYEKIKERADAGDLPSGTAHTALLLSERNNAP